MPKLALLIGLAFIAWLFYRDMQWRRLSSRALWIPGIWLAIISSRSIAFWIGSITGSGSGSSNLEGSPINVIFNCILFISAIVVLRRRGFSWGLFSSENKALISIFGFFLISMFWSPFPVPTLKRVIQEFGCVIIAPIILTERNAASSLRMVFVRVSYVLFPLSVILIRFFPNIGRNVSSVSGTHMLCGVAGHKNSLGELTMVLCLVLLWDLMESRKSSATLQARPERLARIMTFAVGIYLLIICQSATALVCLMLGVALLFAGNRLAQTRNAKRIIFAGVLSIVCALTLNQVLGISDDILRALGRDPSLTGRTDIWQKILEKDTSHIIGAGFRGFWESREGESVAEELGTNRLLTAHNGYLEVYLYGGIVGISLLVALIWSTGLNSVSKLVSGDPIGKLAIVFWPIILINNVSESVFFILGPLWFSILLVTMNIPRPREGVQLGQVRPIY